MYSPDHTPRIPMSWVSETGSRYHATSQTWNKYLYSCKNLLLILPQGIKPTPLFSAGNLPTTPG